MKKEEIMKEFEGIFRDVFTGGRYSEEEYITCVLEASRFRYYLENVVDEDTPSADAIYRIIKGFNIHSLHDKYKGFIKGKYGSKVKGKKCYVIVDETEWGYYVGIYIDIHGYGDIRAREERQALFFSFHL